jgi:hypothetical protein
LVKRKQTFYGWFDGEVYRVSRLPADAPVRPSTSFESLEEVNALIERKRAQIVWWPPLPNQKGLH